MHIAAHAVFGGEQRDQLHLRSLLEYVDGRFERIVNTGRVGDESHTFPPQCFKTGVAQNLHPGFYPELLPLLGTGRPCHHSNQQCEYEMSHVNVILYGLIDSHAGVSGGRRFTGLSLSARIQAKP